MGYEKYLDEDIVEKLTSLDVQVRDDYGDWRSINDILDELLSVFIKDEEV